MVCIGIDPGLSSTGIVVLDGGSLWGTVNIIHSMTKRKGKPDQGRFVAAAKDFKQDQFPIKQNYLVEPSSNIAQIQAYYIIMLDVFKIISKVIAREHDNSAILGLDHCNMAIEIPLGHHMGAGAKIDRMFAVAILAVTHARNVGIWDMYEFRPAEIKKHITGKGNCKKDLIVKEVFKKFGYDTDVADLADAFAIAKLLEHRLMEATNG